MLNIFCKFGLGEEDMTNPDHIASLLNVACSLLAIEARDHEEGHIATQEQRQNIAKVLRAFNTKAEAALSADDAMAVHHIDGNPHNNAPENLRTVPIKQITRGLS